MTRQERQEIAQRHGVMLQSIYQREGRGWTDDEIRNGCRSGRQPYQKQEHLEYIPKFGGHYINGREFVRALLFEVTKAILLVPGVEWDDRDDVEHAFFVCIIYRNLVSMNTEAHVRKNI